MKWEGEGKGSGGDESGQPKESGTHDMGRHTGPFLEGFQAFLMSRAGGKKSERT